MSEELVPEPPRGEPMVLVCAGGGGVGKTTTSAAIAVALARQGKRTLVITVDPARRLADALGVPLGNAPSPVHVEGVPEGRLFAIMPEPRGAVPAFIELLFAGHPDVRDRLLHNRVFSLLEDAAAGVHELFCVLLLAQVMRAEPFDALVIDTAPSRQAFDLITYPARFAALLEGRVLAWIAGLAERTASGRGGVLALGRRTAEDALGWVLGARFIRDVTALFGDLAQAREHVVALARTSDWLLRGPRTRYALIAAPTGAARADVLYLARRLDTLGGEPDALILNRADAEQPAWAGELGALPDLSPAMSTALARLEEDRKARTDAADAAATDLARRLPRVPRVRLPEVAARDPAQVVLTLADAVAPQLDVLLAA